MAPTYDFRPRKITGGVVKRSGAGARTKRTGGERCRESLRECRRDLALERATMRWETANFRFAHRDYSRHARDCVRKVYNDKRPSGLANLTVALFMGPITNSIDYRRLKKSFEEVGVPYAEFEHIRAAISEGDAIAHRYNKKNHANLDELERRLPHVVGIEQTTKDAFARLAFVWKHGGLCERSRTMR